MDKEKVTESMKITKRTKERLESIGNKGERFEDIIVKLLDYYEDNYDEEYEEKQEEARHLFLEVVEGEPKTGDYVTVKGLDQPVGRIIKDEGEMCFISHYLSNMITKMVKSQFLKMDYVWHEETDCVKIEGA